MSQQTLKSLAILAHLINPAEPAPKPSGNLLELSMQSLNLCRETIDDLHKISLQRAAEFSTAAGNDIIDHLFEQAKQWYNGNPAEIPELSYNDDNPSKHNLDQLNDIIKHANSVPAVKIEAAANHLVTLVPLVIYAVRKLTSSPPSKDQQQPHDNPPQSSAIDPDDNPPQPSAIDPNTFILLIPFLQALPMLPNILKSRDQQNAVWQIVHHIVMQKSNKLLDQISKKDQKIVKSIDETIAISLHDLASGQQKTIGLGSYDKIAHAFLVRQGYVLAKPRSYYPYLKYLDAAKLDQTLEKHPRQIGIIIQAIVYAIAAQSVIPQSNPQRLQVLFWGKPGVGKDTLINDILDIFTSEAATPPKIDAASTYDKAPAPIKDADLPRVEEQPAGPPVFRSNTPLNDALVKSGVRNATVVFYELSATLSQKSWITDCMAKDLDPNTDADDIAADIIVLAATNQRPDQMPPKIRDRFLLVEIPTPTPEALTTKVRTTMAKLAQDAQSARLDKVHRPTAHTQLTSQTLTQEQRATEATNRLNRLQHAANGVCAGLEKFVEQIADDRGSGYRRVTQTIQLVTTMHLGAAMLGRSLSEDQTAQLIRDFAPPNPPPENDPTDHDDDDSDDPCPPPTTPPQAQ